jgi:MmyB-like transcription regulator ligand binding domain
MDNRSEVRAFLSSRRAKLSPEQAGIPAYGSRRVAGLRREKAPEIRPAIRRVLAAMTGVPAFLRNHRFDVLAANPLCLALYAPMVAAGPGLPVNSMRFAFLDPHAQAFYPDWPQVARSAVAALRTAAARHPDDQQLMNLIGELSMRSEPFRTWWAAQDGYVHRHGTKRFRHPAIGELELAFEVLELSGDDDLTVLTYSAEPGTPSGDGLELLAGWAATQRSAVSG